MGFNIAARNQQKHLSVTEFCYESVNLSHNKLKNIKKLQPEFPENIMIICFQLLLYIMKVISQEDQYR